MKKIRWRIWEVLVLTIRATSSCGLRKRGNSVLFMETEGLLLLPQEYVCGVDFEPEESSCHLHTHSLNLRRLMSYIYIYVYIYIWSTHS